MGAKNKVIAGDYEGARVISGFGSISLSTQFGIVPINKSTVNNYEVVTDDHRKSAMSGVGRGLVGGFLFGPVGMLAGGISAKNKGVYTVAIQFSDGNRSLVEIDDQCYKTLIKQIF